MAGDRMRASDAERERTVAILREAAGEGRLDVDELDERTAAAYAARTRGELLELTADIPVVRASASAPVPSAPHQLPRIPGRFGFSARWHSPTRRAQAATDVLEFVAPPMRSHGYDLVHSSEALIVFRRERRPAWTYVVAVLVFPIGLIALLHKDRAEIALELRERGEETTITATGDAPLSLRRALSALER